jgi:hypothetical protein
MVDPDMESSSSPLLIAPIGLIRSWQIRDASKADRLGAGVMLAAPVERKDPMNALLEPGMLVRHPQEPDWGIGQVQSNIGGRITVNFEHAGKVVIDGRQIGLIRVFET